MDALEALLEKAHTPPYPSSTRPVPLPRSLTRRAALGAAQLSTIVPSHTLCVCDTYVVPDLILARQAG